jgi:hypothetical protein
MKNFMRAVAIGLLLTLVLWGGGCGSSNNPNAQNDAGGVWQANLTGGEGESSGLSFVVQFSVGGNGALTVSNFQFLNSIPDGCFPVTGVAAPSGTLDVAYNSADQVTGTFSFTVINNGNTLTLTSSSVTGTLSGSSISGGMITGYWNLQGAGSGCSTTTGQFTMTQSTTAS